MFRLFFGCSKQTFKPVKQHLVNSKQQDISNCTSTLLGRGNIREAVVLPDGEDLNEWLAANSVDFFNEISLIWGIVCELGVPTCQAGDGFPRGFEYRWADGDKVKTPIQCSGPKYVDYVLSWVEDLLNNEAVFPVSVASSFPRNFETILKQIYTKLFRIFAIVYTNHLSVLEELGAVAHLNTSFKHFVFFCWEFNLIKKSEEEPLQELIEEIRRINQS